MGGNVTKARIAEQDRRIVGLSDKAEKLESERDGLLDQIGVITEEISELLKKQPYTFDVNDVRGAIRLVGRYIDELTEELAKRDKGIARLKRRRDELELALEIDGRIKSSQDGAIEEIARQRDEALEKLDEYEGREETCTRLSGGNLYVGSKALTEKVAELGRENGRLMREVDALAEERDYWRREVELCMQAAYPPSHSPDRGYHPNVMSYPDRHGYTTPSTLVSDVIDGLRDAAQDGFFKAKLGDVVELEKERDQWKAKDERAIRAMKTAQDAMEQARDERDEAIEAYDKHIEAHDAWHEPEDIKYTRNRFSVLEKAKNERIAKLESERDELDAFAKRLERAAHDELGVTLFGVDYVTEEFMLHVRDTLTAERDEWKALAKSYEENYVGPLREAGFDVHAKAVAAALAALGEELERTRADREEWRAKFGKALDYADEIRRLA